MQRESKSSLLLSSRRCSTDVFDASHRLLMAHWSDLHFGLYRLFLDSLGFFECIGNLKLFLLRFSAVVASFVARTKLLNVEPG